MLPNTPAIIEELIQGLTIEEMDRKPARDRFSIAEVIAHLEHAERTLYRPRIRTLLDKEHPNLPAYKAPVGGFPNRDVRTTLASYTQERAENMKVIGTIEAPDLKRTGVHETYGELTLDNVLGEIAYHDLGHVKQISELVRWLRFYPRMGPFQRDYTVKP